jgi:hypothetical protein
VIIVTAIGRYARVDTAGPVAKRRLRAAPAPDNQFQMLEASLNSGRHSRQ